MASVANLFAEKKDRIDILKFVPDHLKPDQAAEDDGPEDVAGNWGALKQLVAGGGYK